VWNPLGVVGVITAFNFPCAVLGNSLIAHMVHYISRISNIYAMKINVLHHFSM